MPPSKRAQSAREAVATSDTPPTVALANSDVDFIADNNVNENSTRSSGMRMRQEESTSFGPTASDNIDILPATSDRSSCRPRILEPDEPPRFTIDLSLPPEQRYLALCSAFQSEIADLVPLFDEVVGGMLGFVPNKYLHLACRLLLRGVYDKEEKSELKGISEVTGVSMYLLVCFNVLLDLFMGCSSGGAAVRTDKEGTRSKMVHFRTLDWGMPSLRRVVVQLDFVLQKDGPVFASCVTYAGYVGVLTGVRKGLSMSLNFRPNRVDNGVFLSDAKYVWHLLCVLLGRRRSISSTLRGYLLPRRRVRKWVPSAKFVLGKEEDLLDYKGVVQEMGGKGEQGGRLVKTTACYLCFSNGQETTVVEKDRISAKVRFGDEFVVVTNTDETPPSAESSAGQEKPGQASDATLSRADTLAEILHEAQDRQECALHNWRSLQSDRARQLGLQHISGEDRKTLARVEDVSILVQKYPTTNECTHFAAIMDPQEGMMLWCRRWKEPVGAKWIREHMSPTW